MVQYFTRHEVSKILSIRVSRLRYWDRIHLVKASLREKGKAYYGFRDLICLKTAAGLVHKGLSAKKIKSSIDSLQKRIPEFDDSLSNKRIYIFGNRIIISHKNRLIDSQSGQLFFKFDLGDFAAEVEDKVRTLEAQRSAEDWFEEGLKYDGSTDTYDVAVHAYRQVLKLDPSFTDAYVNLGTIFYNERKFAEAEHYYRLALAKDCYHAKACFNLGNVLDEINCREEAVHYYERALEVDPSFSDAHFNLALACEKLRQWERAIRHWKHYLALDSHSRYARVARRHIKVLEARMVS